MLRVWGRVERVPDDDASCLALWERCAYPLRPHYKIPQQDDHTNATIAGALLVGKTNLDQFAAGLVGTRSPYGVARNPFHARYIPGSSSSGSAVAAGLGTDTAGSGRVPAAFNNIIGLKPTRGLLSTRGVVPACRSLDCVSVFALSAQDAGAVLDVAACFDLHDPFARKVSSTELRSFGPEPPAAGWSIRWHVAGARNI
jgi:Asp-tRNA(Asn)/Glu-tRNA(Gln) amidotransferase A subunit family amidase